MINKKLIEQIRDEAVRHDWNLAFSGKSKGNRHLFRVNKIISYLLKKEGGDKYIATLGGWTHDVSLAWGNDNDPKLIQKRTKRFLNKFSGLNRSEIEKIVECVVLHEQAGGSSSLEAKIVHDADVIDKSGLLGIIRHIWKMTNMIDKKIIKTEDDLLKLQKHLEERRSNLYTETAIKLVKKLDMESDIFFINKKEAMNIMKIVSIMANEGKTSDKIARFLVKRYDNKHTKSILSQLSCQYLK